MNSELVKLLEAIAGLKVLVLGEAMLDGYLEGFSDRMSPEAPAPVVTLTDISHAPGGAANTAVNVQALGANVQFLSVIGDDWEGTILRQTLEKHHIATDRVLTQPDRKTLTKQRVIAASQLLVRFDRGSTEPISIETEQTLIDELERSFPECDAVIVSDYGYGILTKRILSAIAKLQHSSPRILVVDSKNLTAYRKMGVTAVKPNYSEAIRLLGLEIHATSLSDGNSRVRQIQAYREQLLDLTGAKIAAITLDTEGAIIFERGQETYYTPSKKASHLRATGAGDTFVSAMTLAIATSATTSAAADLASSAAAVVVGKDGTTACSAQELREYLLAEEIEETRNFASVQEFPISAALFTSTDKYAPDPNWLVTHLESYRAIGRRIVFTNGCFDILHAGHVSYLQQARELGGLLIIGVNSDASVSKLKGPSRPVNPLEDRIQVLAALSCVDYLVPFDEDTPIDLIRLIRPDIYVKGGDYTKETLPEALVVEQLGGEVQILPLVKNRSTTKIIKRIRSRE